MRETIYVLSEQFWEVIEKSGTAVNILMTCVAPPEVFVLSLFALHLTYVQL